MWIDVLLLAAGCVGLYFGGDYLIRGAVGIGERARLSQAVIGLVLVSAGTSAPELAVSLGAALQGLGDFAAGNVVGSNVVNIAVVLGLAAVIRTMSVERGLTRRDLPLLVLISAICVWMLADGHLGRLEAVILFLFTVGNVLWALYQARADGGHAGAADEIPAEIPSSVPKSLGLLAIGVLILVASAEALIRSGTSLAESFGVSDAVIALTVTSIGTSIPEIAASLIAAAKRQNDIAVGNVVGSNLFNIGIVLGITGTVAPIDSSGVGILPLTVMMGLTVGLWLLAMTIGRIHRFMGAVLLAGFVGYGFALL